MKNMKHSTKEVNRMKNKTIVNGEEVEYFHIQQEPDGNIVVTISTKFDIVTAHMSEIMKRIREDGYECVVSKDLHNGIIYFILEHKSDAVGVLNSLNIPSDIYFTMEDTDDRWIYVYVDDLPYHKALQEIGLTSKGVKV